MWYGLKYYGVTGYLLLGAVWILTWGTVPPLAHAQVSPSQAFLVRNAEAGVPFTPGAFSAAKRDPYLVREFSVDGAVSLNVSTPNGNIEVNSVPGARRVRIELYVERGFALWSSNKSMDNYRITTLKRGNAVVASVEPKKKDTGFWGIGEMRFSYVVSVPESLSADLSSLGGKIQLSGVRGEQLVKNSGGDISLSGIDGTVIAQTSGGSIVADQIHGVLKADTKGGDITISSSDGQINARTNGGKLVVNEAKGELRLKSTAGDIHADRIDGSMVAQAVSGNIYASMLNVRSGLSLSAISGNVRAEIPPGGYDLMLDGDDIDFRGETGWFKGERSDRHMEGRLKEGGASINLKGVSGKVTLMFK